MPGTQPSGEGELRRADDATTGRRPRRRRSRWLIATTVVLALALAGTAALAAYLWRTTDEWREEADRVTAIANDVSGERDTLAGELDQARRDLESTDEQLRQVQERLLSLADEQAQTGDELELTRLITTNVATVASQLESCVRGQEQLITALEDVEAYDPQSVSDFARTVSDACNQALLGSEQIKAQLGIE